MGASLHGRRVPILYAKNAVPSALPDIRLIAGQPPFCSAGWCPLQAPQETSCRCARGRRSQGRRRIERVLPCCCSRRLVRKGLSGGAFGRRPRGSSCFRSCVILLYVVNGALINLLLISS